MAYRMKTGLVVGLAATGAFVAAAAAPCDIYASGNTPCIAAHGVTRALYSAYDGPLYQISRGSDSATTDIYPLSAGGVANAATQDNFCASTTCLITVIYDQSGNGNHLTQAPPGGNGKTNNPGGYDNLAAADGAPVTLNGHKAYGVFSSPGTGYRNDQATKTATGDEAQGLYAVMDGTHYNDGCCFDYGNAETSNDDTGDGHMQAIYFGNNAFWDRGAGDGPWIMGDLENGLYTGGQSGNTNPNSPSQTSRFISPFVKGQPGNNWAIRGGNSQSGGLTTYWNGVRPSGGYNPMSQEGAIILGIGGDNSLGAQGTFYEGVMTSGFPSDDTENQVQANIVAAGYAITSLTSGPTFTTGSSISLRVTTPGFNTRYIAHTNDKVNTQVVSSSSNSTEQASATWIVRQGFANSDCFSFESDDTPGSFIRHYGFELYVNSNDGSKQFGEDATFCPRAGLNGQGSSLRSWSYPTRYFRHYADVLYAASNGGPEFFDSKNSFNNDVSFVMSAGFA